MSSRVVFSKLHGKIEGAEGWFGRKKFRATLYAVEQNTGSMFQLWQFTFRKYDDAEYHLDLQADRWMTELAKPEVIMEKDYDRAQKSSRDLP